LRVSSPEDFAVSHRLDQFRTDIHRRTFLHRAGISVGGVALQALMNPGLLSAAETEQRNAIGGLPGLPHLVAKAKRVIFLYMSGGPSHLETFDYRPKLAEMNEQPMPESFTKGQPIAQLQGKELKCLGPLFKFAKHGQSGQEISEALPHIATIADDIAIVRSMHTDQINHDPAHTVMNTGTSISGRPSMGAWITYGLGSASQDLPGFIVMTSEGGRNPQPISQRMWATGFLPAKYQGILFNAPGEPVNYLSNPPGISEAQQRALVETVAELNRRRGTVVPDPEIDTRIAQYEMAFKMQKSIPNLMNFADETKETLELYGATNGADGTFGANCLIARRLAERGVRFIQLYHRDWDHHGDLVHYMNICCGHCDKPSAALVRDLKQRGLLDETLIIWGGEFGRTPMFQGKGKNPGRDHHMRGFSMWLAGGGIKGGTTYGSTDELGYKATENPVHVRDLHATMLHLLGIDHERLSYKFQGLDFRLTGVEKARVVKEILA
jgi:hypothetical protein